MKNLTWMAVAGLWLAGCAHFQNPFQEPYPDLIETQPQLVNGCDMLGTVTETADADRVSVYLAKREMVNKVKARATQLGATHIVWLHRTDASAAAMAYHCPKPVDSHSEQNMEAVEPPGDTEDNK